MAAIEWAAVNGLVTGIGGGRFNPDAPITREQMAVVLNAYINFIGYDIKLIVGNGSFQDENEVSEWAKEAVENIRSAGIIGDLPSSLYEPQGHSNRIEAAQVFIRLIEVLK